MSKPLVVPDIAALELALASIIEGAKLCVQRLPNTPINLWLIDERQYKHMRFDAAQMQRIWEHTPYWAFCWASGLAMAQAIAENPTWVAGKTVVDFGAGSGVVAIAAKQAGARCVIVCDIDPYAIASCRANAALNGVALEYCLDIHQLYDKADVLIAADVLYDRQNHFFLDIFIRHAHHVLIADSRVRDFNHPRYEKIASRQSSTWPDLDENEAFNCVTVYQFIG